jgi:hypothetical protein
MVTNVLGQVRTQKVFSVEGKNFRLVISGNGDDANVCLELPEGYKVTRPLYTFYNQSVLESWCLSVVKDYFNGDLLTDDDDKESEDYDWL